MPPGILPNMNASVLFQLLGFLLVSGALASFDVYQRHIRMYGLLSTGSETLENVQEVFENATDEFNDDFKAIDLLYGSVNAEVVKYVLSKSVNMDLHERAREVRNILQKKLEDNYYNNCELVPGEPEYEIVLACLEEIKNDNHPKLNAALDYNLERLVERGNLPLIKLFVESGFVLPSSICSGIANIKSNTVETINFLVEHGFDIRLDGQSFLDLMMSKYITAADFELYLKHGLPLDYKFVGSNWLELALKAGCVDIAELFFEKGLKLSLRKLKSGYIYTDMELNVSKFVHMMTMKKVFEKVKLMFIGNGEEDSILSYMPREMIHEMTMPLLEVEKNEFLKELYV